MHTMANPAPMTGSLLLAYVTGTLAHCCDERPQPIAYVGAYTRLRKARQPPTLPHVLAV